MIVNNQCSNFPKLQMILGFTPSDLAIGHCVNKMKVTLIVTVSIKVGGVEFEQAKKLTEIWKWRSLYMLLQSIKYDREGRKTGRYMQDQDQRGADYVN